MASQDRTIEITADGSHTVSIGGITYHSHHGAIQESMHVFIGAGLEIAIERIANGPIHVFEMGFGTGLNAMLTAMKASEVKVPVHYTSVESFPLRDTEWQALNYGKILSNQSLFEQIHQAGWNEAVSLSPYFSIRKLHANLLEWQPNTANKLHLVYFDAFAPDDQPELWIEEVFRRLYDSMVVNGILVTYCAKGSVRRNMIAAGFTVERIPGPLGKRQMLRAIK